MIYAVSHRTTVEYAGIVRLAQFILRLRPGAWPTQTVSDFELEIDPAPALRREETGPFGLAETRIAITQPIARLSILSRFRVEVSPPAFDTDSEEGPSLTQLRKAALAMPDLSATGPAGFLFASPIAGVEPEIGDWAREWLTGDRPILAAGAALMSAIHDQFRYDAAATRADTPTIDAFRARHGVCQDFAHVMISAARAHGLPAAYVSGYLRTLPPPGQERLVGADAMHAWAALWCGEALGWVGFDPTNDCIAGTDHIVIGMGRDYADVAPVDGVILASGGQHIDVVVSVVPC